MGPTHKLLEAAAAPTLGRIRRDRQKVPTQLQPLLAYLENHLFDPDLDANQLKRACGVRDNSLPIYFHHALSLPPYAYIEDCRLEVACRLLRDTDLKVWQIAQLLGYSTLQVFSRAFDRWSGLRPSVFRRRAKLESLVAADGNGSHGKEAREAAEESSLISVTTLRKAVNGALESRQADELVRQLVRLYPDSFRQAAEKTTPGNGVIHLNAEQAWAFLRDRPLGERRELVRHRWQMASVELFHLLVEKSIEETRRDAQRGVEVANLALDCLDALAGSVEEDELRELEVRGCAWLANAHRFALDFPQAEVVLGRGERALRPGCDTDARAEFLLVKSAVRYTQRRLDEALVLANETTALLPAVRKTSTKMRAWLHRAHLFTTTGRFGEGFSDLRKAYEWVDRVDDRYLHASFYQTMMLNLALDGKPEEANRILPTARSVFQDLGLEKGWSHLEWTEGLICRARGEIDTAETHFRIARQGFYDQNLSYLGALVALDMAILFLADGRLTETLELAGEVIEVFDGLKVRHEALKAVQLLRHAVAKRGELTDKTLRLARSAFARSQPST